MKEKLLDLMKNEGLRPSQLAEMLDVNPAGISHILAGRNKPGFDLLQKILTRFPRVNPDWLLLDSGKMYRDEYSDVSRRQTEHPATGSDDLFGTAGFSPATSDVRKSFAANGATSDSQTPTPASDDEGGLNENFPTSKATGSSAAKIRQVVIFYDDHTFDSFDPAKN